MSQKFLAFPTIIRVEQPSLPRLMLIRVEQPSLPTHPTFDKYRFWCEKAHIFPGLNLKSNVEQDVVGQIRIDPMASYASYGLCRITS